MLATPKLLPAAAAALELLTDEGLPCGGQAPGQYLATVMDICARGAWAAIQVCLDNHSDILDNHSDILDIHHHPKQLSSFAVLSC